MNTIILHSQDLNIASKMAEIIDVGFEPQATHFRFLTDESIDIAPLRETFGVDINYLPVFDFSKVALFVSDMDSTLINIECIDEIADFANLKPQVARITERAMQGALDFDTALIQRVALLKNLSVEVLDKVYTQRLQPNPGAIELIHFLQTKSIKTAVVSGGFTYFTDRLKADLKLDYARANQLKVANNKLTGGTTGAMINAHAKARFVLDLCDLCQIDPMQVMVVGDGANDLEMMKIAGVAVAYHAKPIVQEKANIDINFAGLDKMIDFFL